MRSFLALLFLFPAEPTSRRLSPGEKIPVTVGSLNSSSVAIHVLATAKRTRDGYDYFVDRMWASVTTWGKHFPSLTFVLGGSGDREVSLGRSGHHLDDVSVDCAVSPETSQAGGEHSICDGFEILRFDACTNEYYGTEGPCCRCQESMRWIMRSEHVRWYAFMDDDVYLRSHSLIALLSRLDTTKPLAITGDSSPRGFEAAVFASKLSTSGCVDQFHCALAFPWMQPAFFNAAALRQYATAIDRSGLTTECDKFGVTHDVGLGILNWMLQTPTILLGRKYAGSTNRIRSSQQLVNYITIHGVNRQNFLIGPQSDEERRFHSSKSIQRFYVEAGEEASIRIGFEAATILVPIILNGFNSTKLARGMDSPTFSPFSPMDCEDIDEKHEHTWCRTTSSYEIPRAIHRRKTMTRKERLRRSHNA